MLEERLSNTYSQHSLGGYNLPQTQQNVYPSISANIPNAPGDAESFYTGNGPSQLAQAPAYDQYGAAPSAYSRPTPRHHAGYGQGSSLAQRHENNAPYQLYRTASWQNTESNGPSYARQTQTESSGYAPPQPQHFNPSEPSMTPSSDPNAAFYYNNEAVSQPPQQYQHDQGHNGQPSGPSRPSDPEHNYYSSQPQGLNGQDSNLHFSVQSSPPMTSDPSQTQYTTSPPSQHSQPEHNTYQQNMQSSQPLAQPPSEQNSPEQSSRQPATQQAPKQPAGYQYWQQQPQNQQYAPPQQSWQAPAPQPSFSQAAFPTAPQHVPETKQPVAVEEPLIEF